MIPILERSGPSVSVLFGLVWAMSGCRTAPTPESPRSRWSLLVALPDTVLLDTAGVEWVSSDARVWLRMRPSASIPHLESATGPVAAVETHHEVSCERRQIRDLEIRAVGVTGEVVGDSVVRTTSWRPASAHAALRDLLPPLCARLSQLDPRGLHHLLGSDRP
jgi:hypothetical protein